MKSFIISIFVFIVLVLSAIGFQLSGYDWKPEIKVILVEESKSILEAKILDLARMRYEYYVSDNYRREEISHVIRQTYADFDSIDVHADLKEFLIMIRKDN